MRIYFYISLIFASVLLLGAAIDACGLFEYDRCLTELPEDGKSEKDTSEKSEDDSVRDIFQLTDLPSFVFFNTIQKEHSSLSIISYFMEIPNPPPEQS